MRRVLPMSVCLFWLMMPAVMTAQEANPAQLAQQVTSSDKQVSLAAIDKLGGLGADARDAVPQLIEAIRNGDDEVRWHACRTLGAIGPDAKDATSALTPLLKSEDLRVRAYAAFALGRIGKAASSSVDSLIEAVFDKDPLVRKAAIRALRAIDPPQDKTLPVVLDILKSGDMSTIMPALASLAEEGKSEVPRLREAMKTPEARYWVTLVLAEIGPDAAEAVPDLLPLLEDDDPELRLQALVALGEIGPPGKSAAPAIQKLLESDEYAAVRHAAAYSLGKVGGGAESTAALQRAMESDDEFLKTISAWALATLNADDPSLVNVATDQIMSGMKSESVDVRRAASRAVVELEIDHDVAAPVLVSALGDEDDSVVANAITALASYGPKALGHIDDALQNKELRHYAVVLIARMGPDSKSVVPALVEIIRRPAANDDDVEFVREVQFALSSIGPGASAAIPELVKSLSSDNEEIRASAAYALGKIGPAARAAVPALRQALRSESFIVKLSAVRALLEIQPGQRSNELVAAPLLMKALTDERPLVRAEAARAMPEVGDLGKQAIPQLRRLLRDDSEVVRKAAQDALKKLQG